MEKNLEGLTKNEYVRKALIPTLLCGTILGGFTYYKKNVLDKKSEEEQKKVKRYVVDAVGAGAGILVAEAVNKYK